MSMVKQVFGVKSGPYTIEKELRNQNSIFHSFLFLVAFLISSATIAQNTDEILPIATAFSQSGEFQKAEELYASLNSEVSEVQIQRAYNFSWWGKYEKANVIFKELIAANPKHLDAYIGIAYNNTWKGLYANAVQYYMKALEIDPQNRSALYGLAHNYNGNLNAEGLEYVLTRIAQNFEPDAEYYFLSGRMHALKLQNIKAKKAYKQGLKIDNGYEPIKDQLRVFEARPIKFFVSGWYGLSHTENTYDQSLRRLDIAYNHSEKLHVYGGYDNTLIMQNRFLRNLEGNAPYYFAGAKYGISKKYFARAEFGYRFFSEIPDQKLYSLENIYFVNASLVLSTFHIVDDRGSEQMLGNGVTAEYKFRREFRGAISYFRNDHLNISGIGNQRILLIPKLSFRAISVDLGFYYDWNNDPPPDSRLYGFYTLANIPILNRLDARLLYQIERGNPALENDLFSTGLTLKF